MDTTNDYTKVLMKLINDFTTGLIFSSSDITVDEHKEILNKVITDANNAVYEIGQNPCGNIKDNITRLNKVMCNASLINIDDIKLLSQKDIEDYLNIIKEARKNLSIITREIIDNISSLKATIKQPKQEEDLTKLSKEELIERLRRK